MDAVEQVPAPAGPSRVAQVREFLEAVRAELRKVSWPTQPELVRATRMIVGLSVVLGLVIGLLDWVLQKILVDGIAALAR
jgi:preprotein translocase SecE subunit